MRLETAQNIDISPFKEELKRKLPPDSGVLIDSVVYAEANRKYGNSPPL